ncbi:hypothetical protein [Streptomyces longispororuber]|uniref:hypothetical protein n=1 Tax=Streptomyces longispororuber TaxID=68230 RepID=UPI00167EB928|nr:hypothetical protein [Streptomyces longispororuber]
MHGKRAIAGGAIVTAAALLMTASPMASAEPKLPTPEEAMAFSLGKTLTLKIQDGTATTAEIENFKKLFPDVAKVLEDPSQTEVSVQEAVITEDGEAVSPETGKPLTAAQLAEIEPPADAKPSDPSEEEETPEETAVDPAAPPAEADGDLTAKVKGGKWKMTHITHTHRSYLGQTILKYHTYARFNYKGGKVRAWGKRYDRFSNESDVVKIGSRIENRKSKVPASSATSMMKRHVELCFAGSIGCYANIYPWAKVKVYGSGKTKVAGSGA